MLQRQEQQEVRVSENHLICPITLEIMEDPVMASDGITYERRAIKEWLLQKGTSPVTREPITNVFILNRIAKALINEYKNAPRIVEMVNLQSKLDEYIKNPPEGVQQEERIALATWLKSVIDMAPENVIESLVIMHNMQRRCIDPVLVVVANSVFIKLLPYIDRSIKQDSSPKEHRSVGMGLVHDRVDFLEELIKDDKYGGDIEKRELARQIEEMTDALKIERKDEGIVAWLQGKASSLVKRSETVDIERMRQNAMVKARSAQTLNKGVEEYAEISLLSGNYVDAAKCYDFLRQSDATKKKAEEGLREVEAKLILCIPNTLTQSVLSTLDKEIDKSRLESAGDLFLQAGRYDNAVKIYHRLLKVVQEEIGKSSVNVNLLQKEREVFIKFAHAHNNERKGLKLVNYGEELTSQRSKLRDSHGEWNNYFISLLKKLVLESQKALGDKYKCAVVALGEVGMKEAFLYPEVQMMIITENSVNSSGECTAYFKTLIDLIKVKIITLGEMKALPIELVAPDGREKHGVRFNDNVLFPKILQDAHVKIGTVQELLSSGSYDESIQNTWLLANRQLYINYLEALDKANESQKPNIFRLFSSYLQEYQYTNPTDSFNVRSEILKYPTVLVNRLFAYYRSERIHNNYVSISGKLQALLALRSCKFPEQTEFSGWNDFLLYYLTPERVQDLEKWLNFGRKLRLKENQYSDGADIVYLKEGEEGAYVLSDAEKEELQRLYSEVMLPLYRVVNLWVKMLGVAEELQKSWIGTTTGRIEKVVLNSPAEISKVLLEESCFLMQEYKRLGNTKCVEQANWYFEKAAEFDLEQVEKAWVESIKVLDTGERGGGCKLEFLGDEAQLIEIGLSAENAQRFSREGTLTVEEKGNYFNIKVMPEYPGMEYAISSLSHIMFGYTTAPLCTIAKATIDGAILPVLISRHVIGKALDIEDITAESFGLSFIKSVLTTPEHDKLEDFIMQPMLTPSGDKKQRLMCMNNDRGFMESGAEAGLSWFLGKRYISKSILYCSDEVLTKISEPVKQKILNLKEEMVVNWLKKVIAKDESIEKLFTVEEKQVLEGRGIKLNTEFYEITAISIYNKILKLQTVIDNPGYINILESLDSVTSAIYAKVLEFPQEERFGKLAKEEAELNSRASRYLVEQDHKLLSPKGLLSKLEALRAHLGGLRLAREELMEKGIAKSDYPIELKKMIVNGGAAAVGVSVFDNNIFKDIARRYKTEEEVESKQREVLDIIQYDGLKAAYWFTRGFDAVDLSGCVTLKNEDLYYIVPTEATWLDISGCRKLTLNVLNLIVKYHPKVQTLYLSASIKTSSLFPGHKTLSSLKMLVITNCDQFDNKIKSIIGFCPKLETLHLLDASEVPNLGATSEALLWAVENRKKELAENFLKRGIVGANIIGNTALHTAAWHGNIEMIPLCLESIGINMTNRNKETPLMLAATNGKRGVVEFLLQKGADINMQDMQGSTAIHLAISSCGDKIIVKSLCEKSADLTITDHQGQTPRALAESKGKKEIVEFLGSYR